MESYPIKYVIFRQLIEPLDWFHKKLGIESGNCKNIKNLIKDASKHASGQYKHCNGFTRVVLEGDSQTLITALKTGSHTLAHFGHIVQDIRYLASSLSNVSYSHVHRQCNTVAHSLVRWAIIFSFLQVWMEDVPQELADVLQADLQSLWLIKCKALILKKRIKKKVLYLF